MERRIFSYAVDQRRIMRVVMDDPNAKVNTLTMAALRELRDVFEAAMDEHDQFQLRAVVLSGKEGRDQTTQLGAGANIEEMYNADPTTLELLLAELHKICEDIELCEVPWIADLGTLALGGILELALACTYRVGCASGKVGFPEVTLGLIPGGGGTVRAPQLMGPVPASIMIVGGRQHSMAEALSWGLVDMTYSASFDPWTALPNLETNRLKRQEHKKASANDVEDVQKALGKKRLTPFERAVMQLVMGNFSRSPDEGLAAEREYFLDRAAYSGHTGMRAYLLQQSLRKVPVQDVAGEVPIDAVVVAGIDGLMGNAIAFLALRAGFRVLGYLPEEALETRALQELAKKYEAAKLSEQKLREDLERLSFTADYMVVRRWREEFKNCLVIEALLEDKGVKDLFMRAMATTTHGIVVSNSSWIGPCLNGASFLAAGGDARRVAGLHFFSPAERSSSRLVEIVASPVTAPWVIAALHAFVLRLGKLPLLVRDSEPGFFVNAVLASYLEAAAQLWWEGVPLADIDAAMGRIFPLGPFQVVDFAGLVPTAGMFQFYEGDRNPVIRLLIEGLIKEGRMGGRDENGPRPGFYPIVDQKPCAVPDEDRLVQIVDSAMEAIDGAAARPRGHAVRTAEQIVEELLRAIWERCNRLYTLNIVSSKDHADMALMAALGFNSDLGGPFYYAEVLHHWQFA